MLFYFRCCVGRKQNVLEKADALFGLSASIYKLKDNSI